MDAVLQINTAPIAHARLASERPSVPRHPAQASQLSLAGERRIDEDRPLRLRSVVAALVLGLMMGAMAWMQADDPGVGTGVDDAKIDVMATVDS